MTVEIVRNAVREYLYSDQNKKASMKKLVSDYFTAAKKELEELYNQIYESIDLFKFDNIIFSTDEKVMVEKLVNEEYNELTCSNIAIILPKLIKCANYEDGHFGHLRNYLKNEKEKVPKLFDEIILNLPYFRENIAANKEKEFVEISSEWLREVNVKLRQIKISPKRIHIKYSTCLQLTQSTMRDRKTKVIHDLTQK